MTAAAATPGQKLKSATTKASPLKKSPSMSSRIASHDTLIRQLRQKHSQTQEQLTQLEQQIYDLEGSYLRETWSNGNAVKGWGHVQEYAKKIRAFNMQTPAQKAAIDALSKEIDQARIFSLSSKTSPAYVKKD